MRNIEIIYWKLKKVNKSRNQFENQFKTLSIDKLTITLSAQIMQETDNSFAFYMCSYNTLHNPQSKYCCTPFKWRNWGSGGHNSTSQIVSLNCQSQGSSQVIFPLYYNPSILMLFILFMFYAFIICVNLALALFPGFLWLF